jgi:16S rRNA (guanine527-N7)-methyltransferase
VALSSREFKQKLARRARRVGLHVPAGLADRLEAYLRLLALWNEKVNLTALDLREPTDEAVDRLLVEPMVASRHLPDVALTLMDVGSGGGSPAIPMKLAVPGLELVMVEAKTRKSAFLREAVRHLELRSARVENARYEELLARPDLHEAIDVVTVRAVRVEVRVLMSLQAFLRPGGDLFLFRGPAGGEVPATLTPPLVWQATHQLVDSLKSRLVIVRKAAVGAAPP